MVGRAIEFELNEDEIRNIPINKRKHFINKIKGGALTLIHDAKSGHCGGSVSISEILFAYSLLNRYDEDLIISGGHCCPAVYSLGYLFGNVPIEKLKNFRNKNGFSGHIDRFFQVYPTGPLGLGTVINGLAIGNRLKGTNKKVYGVFGDGECDESIVFAGIRNAVENDLNVCYIINYNGKQLSGDLINDIHKFSRAVGGLTEAVHWAKNDVESLLPVLAEIKKLKGAQILFVEGKKGQGISFMENHESGWHGDTLEKKHYHKAMDELGLDPFSFRDDLDIITEEESTIKSLYDSAIKKLDKRFGTETMPTRKANEYLSEIDDGKLVVFNADMGGSVCAKSFEKKCPGRYFNVGINEELATNNALGVSLKGFKPFVLTFDGFSYYPFQVIHHADYVNPPFVAFNFTHSEYIGADGPTHAITDNLGAWYGLQNVKVITNFPCYNQAVQGIRTQLLNPDKLGLGKNFMVYNRFFRPATRILYSPENVPDPGKADVLVEGEDLTIITTGQQVWESLIAAYMLREGGINPAVINVGYIKPLDAETIFNLSRGKDVYVIEAHNPDVGLTSIISKKLLENGIPVKRFRGIGITEPIPSDSIEEQKRFLKMDGISLYERIKKDLLA